MDLRRSQEVDTAACHALMMRKQGELLQRLHKAEEALQHSARDCIICRHPPLACAACCSMASHVMSFTQPGPQGLFSCLKVGNAAERAGLASLKPAQS